MLTLSRVSLLAAGISTGIASLLAQSPRPMTLVDIINLPQIADPQLSPDRRQIVLVQSEANWKADRRISHLWRINADGSGLVR